MMGVLKLPIWKTSMCLSPPSPDLTTFCRLEEHGLVVVGLRIEPERRVLASRVVEPDGWCRRLRVRGRPEGHAHASFGVQRHPDGCVTTRITRNIEDPFFYPAFAPEPTCRRPT